MEQKRALIYNDGSKVLPHTIYYLNILNVGVETGLEPSYNSHGIDYYTAKFMSNGEELKPMRSSQGKWWLQSSSNVDTDRIIIVSDNEITFQCDRHKHVCLGLLEEIENGFSIKTTRGEIESKIIVTVNKIGIITIGIKGPINKNIKYYMIANGKLADASYYMSKLRAVYEKKMDKNDLDQVLFVAMLNDQRLYERLSLYLNAIPNDFDKKRKKVQLDMQIERNRDVYKANMKFESKKISLECDYQKAIKVFGQTNDKNLGLVKVKK